MNQLSDLYTPEFFSGMAERCARSARAAWPFILKVLGESPRSVADFGCGPAAWISALRTIAPSTEVLGIDHPGAAEHPMMIGRGDFVPADLTSAVDIGRRFDLALALEVAEHLPASAADTFVETLARHSDCVLFSAAVPGQPGTGHINCQWPSYWIARFQRCGLQCIDRVRPIIWENPDVLVEYRQNMFIFARRPLSTNGPDWGGADLVHPDLFKLFLPRPVPRTPRNLLKLITGRLEF
jgi:hypothetical protein